MRGNVKEAAALGKGANKILRKRRGKKNSRTRTYSPGRGELRGIGTHIHREDIYT